MVREISGRVNVRSGKSLSGEMSGRGSLRWRSIQSGNCLFGEMSVGEVSSPGTVPILYSPPIEKLPISINCTQEILLQCKEKTNSLNGKSIMKLYAYTHLCWKR